MCAPSSLLDLRDQGSQASTFLEKRGQKKKSNAFRANTKQTERFVCFNQIFIRGVNRRRHPLAVPPADKCTHCDRQC